MNDHNAALLAVPAASDPVVGEILKRLVELYNPQRVYLFGSAARGDAGPDSDYDFMVIVPDSTPKPHRQTKALHERLLGIDAAVEVLVWTKAEFDNRLHLRASLPSTVVREGILLYGSGPDSAG
jgi:predicted nucleotidyltransferase